MATAAEIQLTNECFTEACRSPALRKEAADLGGDYTARRVRENSFVRKLIEPTEIPDSRLNVFAHDDRPSVTYDMEPDVMMAAGVPFTGQPVDVFLECDRYYVTGHRVLTPRVSFDEMQLKTYRYDVKEVFANNMVRDALGFEDTAGVIALNAMLGGTANTILPGSGVAQWTVIGGGIIRPNVREGTLQTGTYRYHIPTTQAVCNYYTIGQFAKWQRDEAGGDMAEETLVDGYWARAKLFGIDWLGTIKNELIPNYRVYHFGPKKFLGRSILFSSPRMHIEEKYWNYMFFVEYVIGTVFAHPGAVSIVDYTP